MRRDPKEIIWQLQRIKPHEMSCDECLYGALGWCEDRCQIIQNAIEIILQLEENLEKEKQNTVLLRDAQQCVFLPNRGRNAR